MCQTPSKNWGVKDTDSYDLNIGLWKYDFDGPLINVSNGDVDCDLLDDDDCGDLHTSQSTSVFSIIIGFITILMVSILIWQIQSEGSFIKVMKMASVLASGLWSFF